MTQQPIRTKWHRIRECIKNDGLYLTAPRGGLATHYREAGLQLDKLNELLDQADKLPKFVIEEELLGLIKEDAFQLSMRDMYRAKVARLPFPSMLVEISRLTERGSTLQFTVILCEGKIDPKHKPSYSVTQERCPWDFYAWVFSYNKDPDGEYACVSPALIGINLNEMDNHDCAIWLGFNGAAAGYLPEGKPGDRIDQLVESTFQKDGGVAGSALLAALLLMTTQGVVKEVVEVSPHVNKERVKRGRPIIPTHTYIRIGKVYKTATGDEAEDYDPRKSPRPHWRRGHNRRVRFGKGRQSYRLQYFPPRLVAFHGDAIVEGLKEAAYKVSA